MSEVELDGELVSEEDVEGGEADRVRALPDEYGSPGLPSAPIRSEVTTAALAVAGGAIAGAATVAAVRAVGEAAVGSRRRRRRPGRRRRQGKVVASRSFLVDIHLLDN